MNSLVGIIIIICSIPLIFLNELRNYVITTILKLIKSNIKIIDASYPNICNDEKLVYCQGKTSLN